LLGLDRQFQVNSYTTGNQLHPRIDTAADGSFVVSWYSQLGSPGGDDDLGSIQMRRFSADGEPRGQDLQVNGFTISLQRWPDIEVNSDGSFVVVWENSEGSYGTDTDRHSVQMRLFDPNGVAIGDDFQVNTYTTSRQRDVSIAMASGGSFVVSWLSFGSYSSDPAESIQAQMFAPTGSPIGGEFQVNSYTTSVQSEPSIAMSATGEFVVVWKSYGSYESDLDRSSIQGQLFAADGSRSGLQFQVNTHTEGFQSQASVDMASDSSFVVCWTSAIPPDVSSYHIRARVFDAAGSPQGEDFQVNTQPTVLELQLRSDVAIGSTGDFWVVWDGSDLSSTGIQARHFASNGVPLVPQFAVNVLAIDTQVLPAISMSTDDRFVVVWEDRYLDGPGDLGISGIFLDPIFVDGFESGDTTAWSSSVP
jgi:hypothetical protein